ncbi:MAG: AAA family ATPase, partial [Salinivirgaceae bacterium]|nr:AAA family ATPase [Salinivirgaceae bacterium]
KIYSERFGQSEKNLQDLFDRYYEYAAYKGITPILFLDNADAFLSSRTSDSATIIIQETLQQMLCAQLDNPEMIFIATAKNLNLLPSEFNNRFIYKIELQNPSTTVSPSIWKSNFPQLTEQQCMHLAQQFNYTPRQIGNIAIQCLLEEFIDNQKINIADIERICTSSS